METEMFLGGIPLLVAYTYDPGRPASGPYAPEYPTLEVENVSEMLSDECTSLLDLIEEVGGLGSFKRHLLVHLEKTGELRGEGKSWPERSKT
ncbi:MAG TPA: hypothetical protein VN039_02595 [Nitrospira sp.]|nr:hypothetical protein [Nitrospira sp.]